MADNAREIENLVYTYADRIDTGDLAGVAELFRHGRIEAGPGMVFEGVEQVLSLYNGATRLYDGIPRTRHVTTNVMIEVNDDGNTANSKSYYTVFQQTDALPLQPIIAGHYHDSFRRVSGRWCFDTREMFVDLVGDLTHHLLFELEQQVPGDAADSATT